MRSLICYRDIKNVTRYFRFVGIILQSLDSEVVLLEIKDLRIEGYAGEKWIEIVHGVDLTLHRGEVMGLIGESGAGKSTIGLAAMGFTRDGCRISGGSVEFGHRGLVAEFERVTTRENTQQFFGCVFHGGTDPVLVLVLLPHVVRLTVQLVDRGFRHAQVARDALHEEVDVVELPVGADHVDTREMAPRRQLRG